MTLIPKQFQWIAALNPLSGSWTDSERAFSGARWIRPCWAYRWESRY